RFLVHAKQRASATIPQRDRLDLARLEQDVADLVELRDEHPECSLLAFLQRFARHALLGGVRAPDLWAPRYDLGLALAARFEHEDHRAANDVAVRSQILPAGLGARIEPQHFPLGGLDRAIHHANRGDVIPPLDFLLDVDPDAQVVLSAIGIGDLFHE